MSLQLRKQRDLESVPWCYLLWGAPAVLATAASVAYGSYGLSLELAGVLWTASVAWVGVGCYINGRLCGRVHCRIDGILLPPLSVAGALNLLGLISFSWSDFWVAFAIILVASFVPEFTWKRYS